MEDSCWCLLVGADSGVVAGSQRWARGSRLAWGYAVWSRGITSAQPHGERWNSECNPIELVETTRISSTPGDLS